MKPEEPEHVLLNTRVVAAVGLLGLGGSVGLALMTAKILIYVGLGISLASAVGVIWLYAKYLRRAYRSVSKRIPYRGPQPAELLIATGMAVVLATVSASVFSVVIIRELPSGRAFLEPGTPQFVKIPNDAPVGFVNIELKNNGTLPVENANILMVGHVSSDDLAIDTLSNEMNALVQALDEVDQKRPTWLPMHVQIQPGSAAVISLEDVKADQWPYILGGKAKPPSMTVQMTDDRWRDFQQGKLAIYVLYAAKFEDEGHRGTSYWSARQCMYYRGAVPFHHDCGPNRTELITRPRH